MHKPTERRHDTFGRLTVAYAQRIHRAGHTRAAADILRAVGHPLATTRRLLLETTA